MSKKVLKWTDKKFLTDEIWEGASVQAHVIVEKYRSDGKPSLRSHLKLSDCSQFIGLEFDLSTNDSKGKFKRKRRKAKRLKRIIDKWYEEYMSALDYMESHK